MGTGPYLKMDRHRFLDLKDKKWNMRLAGKSHFYLPTAAVIAFTRASG